MIYGQLCAHQIANIRFAKKNIANFRIAISVMSCLHGRQGLKISPFDHLRSCALCISLFSRA